MRTRIINRRRFQSPTALRSGLTLYEVVLALAILLGSMAALSQLISIGTRASTEARLRTDATLKCQSRMSEVIAGAVPMEDVSDQPYDDVSPGWYWSLNTTAPSPHTDLIVLTVTVSHRRSTGQVNESVALTRYIRDPQIYLDAAAAAEVESSTVEEVLP